jgi:hypothetical protein
MNIIKLRKGDTVLDPMAGSGTVCIEAAINGIHSIGIDISPFCSLMIRAKTFALSANPGVVSAALREGSVHLPEILPTKSQQPLFGPESAVEQGALPDGDGPYSDIATLCFLDAMGYAARRAKKTLAELYPVIVDRAVAPPAPEEIRGAKERLTLNMDAGYYVETDDQAALAARMDLSLPADRAPSFARFVACVERLCDAILRPKD